MARSATTCSSWRGSSRGQFLGGPPSSPSGKCVAFSPCSFPAAAPAPPVASSGAANGAALFQASCFACHGPAAPALNAPQAGVKDNWAPRLEKAGGRDGLVANAITGVAGTAMAPRGGSSLTDDEMAAAVDHILAEVGL